MLSPPPSPPQTVSPTPPLPPQNVSRPQESSNARSTEKCQSDFVNIFTSMCTNQHDVLTSNSSKLDLSVHNTIPTKRIDNRADNITLQQGEGSEEQSDQVPATMLALKTSRARTSEQDAP